MRPEPLYRARLTFERFCLGGVWHRDVPATWIVKRIHALDRRAYATRPPPTDKDQMARDAINECFTGSEIEAFRRVLADRTGRTDLPLEVWEIPADECKAMAHGEVNPFEQMPQGGLTTMWTDAEVMPSWVWAFVDGRGCESDPPDTEDDETISLTGRKEA